MTRSPRSLPPRSATTTPRSRIRRRPPRVPAASRLRSAAGPRWRYGRALLRRARRLPLDRSLPRGPRDQSSRRRVEAHEHRPHPRTRSPPRRLRPLILEYRPTAARGQPPFELIASGMPLHGCGRHHHGDQSPRHHGDTRPGQVGSRAHTTLPRSHQHVLVDRPAETHHLIEVVRGVHRVVRSNPKSPGNSTQSGERRSRAMPCATPHGSPAGLPCGRCHLVKYPVSLHTGTGVTS